MLVLDRTTLLYLFIYKPRTKTWRRNLNKNFSVAWNMVKKRSTGQRKVTNTNAEISLTTSFLAQELLNELSVRALAGAELGTKLFLAGAEMVNL